MCISYRLHASWWTGDIGALVEEHPPLVANARARGDRLALSHYVLGAGIQSALLADDVTVARMDLDEAFGPWRDRRKTLQYAYGLRAWLGFHLYRRDAHAALDVHEEMMPAVRRSRVVKALPYMRAVVHDVAARAALLALAQGVRPRLARRLARDHIRRLNKVPLKWARTLARLHRAQLLLVDGDKEAARDGFRQAADDFLTLEMRLLELVARACHGRLVGDAGPLREAQDWLAHPGVRRPPAVIALLAPAVFE